MTRRTTLEADLSASLPDALSESAGKAKRARKHAAFRLKAVEPLETMIQSQIMDYLRVEQARGRVSWYCRTNGGGMKTRTGWIKFYVLHLLGCKPDSRGKPDIEGMLPGGRYFALEVKRPKTQPTPEQAYFLATVREAGGIGEVVRHWEDVKSLLWGEVDPARDQRTYEDQYAGVVV